MGPQGVRTALVGIVCLLSAGVLSGTSQAPPQSQQPPRFASGVEIVAVDVTVLDRDGAPLTSLGPDDFAVTVDGKARRVVSLQLLQAGSRELRAAGAPQPGAKPATPQVSGVGPGRLFVLAVDRQHIPVGAGLPMLDAAARFIDTLQPEDRLGVYTIPPTSSQFQLSTDREAAKDAVRKAPGLYRPPISRYRVGPHEAMEAEESPSFGPGGAIDSEGMPDPAHSGGTASGKFDPFESLVARECESTGETGKLLPFCRARLAGEIRTIAGDYRNRAQVTLTSLEQLVRALAPVEGPKHVVLITGGPVFSKTEISQVMATAAAAGSSRVTIHAIQVHDPGSRANADQMRATPFETDQTNSASVQLATATGGLWITPAAPAVGFERLSKELSASYLLGIQAEPADRDGKVHGIEVKVNAARPGTFVRARKSFLIDPSAPRLTLAPPPEAKPAAPAAAAAGEAEPADEPVAADLDAMVDRLGDYIDRFDTHFAGFVAEERYVQVIHPWHGNPESPEKEKSLEWKEGEAWQVGKGVISRRQLVSDVLLVPVSGQPMAFRDVATVDGRQVRDRADRVQALFLSNAPDRVGRLRTLSEESARYNIGGNIKRTLNVPTVALAFMRRAEQHRFRFKRLKDEVVGGRSCRVLSYREHERPTLVGTGQGGDIPIEGRIWIDAANGDVLRTELRWELSSGGRRSCIQVDFVREPRTPVLVPSRMWEWHENADVLGSLHVDKTVLEGVAVYSNLRHFEVSTSERIK